MKKKNIMMYLGLVRFLNVFERSVFWSRLHFDFFSLDKNTIKTILYIIL